MPRARPKQSTRKAASRGGGRPVGAKNRVQLDVRQAFADLMQMNAVNFSGWLATIANGQRSRYRGADKKLREFYLVKPDPKAAFDVMLAMAEFHVPKLARIEQTGAGGGPIVIQSTPVDENL